jgi:hypothetical protein
VKGHDFHRADKAKGIDGALAPAGCLKANPSRLIRFAVTSLAFACALLVTAPLCAKTPETTGTLNGKLTDIRSLPLAQAVVFLRNSATGVAVRGITEENGNYRFSKLDPGEYTLEAEVPRLGKGSVNGILISAGHATRVQAALVMQLTIPPPTLEDPLHELDPVAAAVTSTIPSQELNAVPVVTRNWQAFAALTPATQPSGQGNGRSGGQIGTEPSKDEEPTSPSLSIEGPTGFESAQSIDGIPSPPAFHAENGRQSRSTESLGPSAVESMQARSGNAPAESGSTLGGLLNLVTGHGTNGLHGQAFYLNRQSLWGAQNPFTQWIQQTAPASGIDIAQYTPEPYTPVNSRQTVGIGIGRQIKRDKLYWFAAFDGLYANDPAVATVRHPADFFAEPSEAQLTVFAALLNLPSADPWDEGAAAYSAGLEQLAGLLGPVPRTSNQSQLFGRIDWQISERHHLSAEVQASTENAPAGALSRTSETYASHSFGNAQANFTWGQARWDSFLTANLLNTLSAQFAHSLQGETPQTPSAFEAPFVSSTWNQLPQIVADSKYGFVLGKRASVGGTHNPDENAFAAQETLSWVRGAHLIKAGLSFDHIADSTNTLVNQTGTYSYADILNFLTDASSFLAHGFTSAGTLQQFNCDSTAKIKQFQDGAYTGIGPYPCYAWYTQRIGPSNWRLSTNDLAAFATEQWQPFQNLTLSAGIRTETEQLPPTILEVANPDIPGTEKLPAAALTWGPRFGLAWSPFSASTGKGTVIRLGAGLYFGRIDNAAILAALTQTGSPNGDQNFFFKPTNTGAPPFPYVFPSAPQTVVTPGAVSFALNFRRQQVDQAVFSIEQNLPDHWLIAASALVSLGRHLPISIDNNLQRPTDPTTGNPETITYNVVDSLGAGPIKTPTITVPLYTARPNADYQEISSIESRANSTYDAFQFKVTRYGSRGLSLHAHYLYAHATDWNPNESGNVAVNDVLDPANFALEYGTSNLDIRHAAGVTLLYAAPWKLRDWAGYFANGWSVAAVGQFRSGLPFTMRTGGYIPSYYEPLLNGSYQLVEGAATGMNGSGGDNRIYGTGSGMTVLNIGRNTYRYPATWTADTRLSKRFEFSHRRELEFLAESFNLFNHQNVTLIETTGYTIERGSTTGGKPTFNFMTGLTSTGAASPTQVEFGKPLDVNATNFYRPREVQLGLRARF